MGCPHARGGEPRGCGGKGGDELSCPHARGGEPLGWRGRKFGVHVVPTPVGVNRSIATILRMARSVVPTPVGVNRIIPLAPDESSGVVPTPVGVNRPAAGFRPFCRSLSPRPWG